MFTGSTASARVPSLRYVRYFCPRISASPKTLRPLESVAVDKASLRCWPPIKIGLLSRVLTRSLFTYRMEPEGSTTCAILSASSTLRTLACTSTPSIFRVFGNADEYAGLASCVAAYAVSETASHFGFGVPSVVADIDALSTCFCRAGGKSL